MKLKKVLASILAICMVLGTMGFTVFAEATVYNVSNDADLADAISKAVDGDTIKLAAGNYTGGIRVGENITLEGATDADGKPATVFSGDNGTGYYDGSICMGEGVIKNIKITDAWKGITAAGTGDLTIDNVTTVEITYAIHVNETRNPEDTITVQNCNIDVSWACSFTGGPYKIVMTNNVFTANKPYGSNTSANAINTFNPNMTVSQNVFETGAKILVRDDAKDIVIGTNYYADGIENALNDGGADGVTIDTYYADRDMTEEKITPKGTLNSCRVNVDRADRTFITTEVANIYAENSIKFEVYDAEDTLLATTVSTEKVFTDVNFPANSFSIFTGINSADNYWTTQWENGKLRGDYIPAKAILYADGIKVSVCDVVMKDNYTNDIIWNDVPGVVKAPEGTITYGFTSQSSIWGETTNNAKESIVIELYAEDEKIGTTTLLDESLIDGDVYVTWSLPFNGMDNSSWDVEWYGDNPSVETVPTKVVLCVDGKKVAENNVQMNAPDNLNKVKWDELEAVYAPVRVKYTLEEKTVSKGLLTLKDALDATKNMSGDVVIDLNEDATLPYKAREAYGVEAVTSITINGNGNVLTLDQKDSDWSSIGMENTDGVFKMNDVKVIKTGYGATNGAWNTHAINFDVNVEFTNVDFENSINVGGATATLTNVNVVENGGYYGVWIPADAQTVTINGGSITATNGGRGIKIADEYVASPSKVNLNVTGMTFETAKKAAVLVSSTAGAAITASNNDITNVAADSVNFAWVDEKWAAYANLVTVNGNPVVVESEVATTISVSFVEESAGVYNIVLDGHNGDIYEFVSAELAFLNNSKTLTGQGMGYEIVPEANIIVNENIAKEGTFNFNIKPNAVGVTVDRITGTEIVLGKVVFPANGKYDFKVDAANSKVVTTKYNTNDEEEYTANGTLKLIADATGINSEVKAATRDVIVKVDFVHDIADDAKDFKVTLRDADGNTLPVQTLDIKGNKGITEFPGIEIGNVTVTLEAEGFRKFTYRTTLEKGEGAVVLNFWNDWKRGTTEDPKLAIEEGKEAVEKNFIAGDIAMDYIVDKYDLAAVTSYYGTYGYTNANFVKYDLNRDGKIDIDDVAYVLHNFGK